jgi:hypothetical protein
MKTKHPEPSGASPPKATNYELIWVAMGIAVLAGIYAHRHGRPLLPLAPCPMQAALDLPCVFCGGTRAVEALSRGRWTQALALNPGVVLGSIAAGAYWLYCLWVVATGRSRRWRLARLSRRGLVGLRWTLIILVLLNWAYLIIVDR